MPATDQSKVAARRRTYGGETADERQARRREQLLAAGIELLGEEEGAPSVRAVCARAALTQRYFYESFDSSGDFALACFDRVAAGAADCVAAALDEAPRDPETRARAAVVAYLHYVLDHPGRAQVLFRPPEGGGRELAEHRSAAVRGFVALAMEQAREVYGTSPGSDHLVTSAAYMIAGGLGELVLAFVRGELDCGREQLVEDASRLLAGFGAAAAEIGRGQALT